LAKAALICAVIGIFLFGITSIPAVILGFAARSLIDDPLNNFQADDMTLAMAGIIIGTIGCVLWGVWLIFFAF